MIPWLIAAAILGDAVGYRIGKHAGRRIFNREDSRWFHRRHLDRARAFYEKHGGKTIVLARFLAIVRTFAPTVAGAAEMPYRRFAFYNVLGGVGWVTSMILLGYFAGKALPNVEVLLFLLLAIVVAVSLAPAAWHLLRERRRLAQGNAD
jgi:membrane-associated protein